MAERERLIGATEEEAAAILRAERDVLVQKAQEEKMATLLEPLLRDVALLEGRRQEAQLDRLRAQRSIDHVLWTIDERAREDARRAFAARTEAVRAAEKAEADRLRGLKVDGIAQQLLPGLKALLPSASHFAQAVGMRVVEIIDTPELAWHLPDAVEPSVDSVGKRSNADRFRVSTGYDSCRVALLSDNSYAVLYNPQPETRELQTARQIAEGIDTSDGARVNPHIFGVHVAPFGYNIIQPFFVTNIREDGRTLNGTVPVDTHEASPLLKVVNNILSNGRVGLPKRYKPAPDAL